MAPLSFFETSGCLVPEIGFGPPTIESKIGKNYINFDNCNLFFKHLALWSCPNIFGPPTMVFAVFDFKDWAFHVHD